MLHGGCAHEHSELTFRIQARVTRTNDHCDRHKEGFYQLDES